MSTDETTTSETLVPGWNEPWEPLPSTTAAPTTVPPTTQPRPPDGPGPVTGTAVSFDEGTAGTPVRRYPNDQLTIADKLYVPTSGEVISVGRALYQGEGDGRVDGQQAARLVYDRLTRSYKGPVSSADRRFFDALSMEIVSTLPEVARHRGVIEAMDVRPYLRRVEWLSDDDVKALNGYGMVRSTVTTMLADETETIVAGVEAAGWFQIATGFGADTALIAQMVEQPEMGVINASPDVMAAMDGEIMANAPVEQMLDATGQPVLDAEGLPVMRPVVSPQGLNLNRFGASRGGIGNVDPTLNAGRLGMLAPSSVPTTTPNDPITTPGNDESSSSANGRPTYGLLDGQSSSLPTQEDITELVRSGLMNYGQLLAGEAEGTFQAPTAFMEEAAVPAAPGLGATGTALTPNNALTWLKGLNEEEIISLQRNLQGGGYYQMIGQGVAGPELWGDTHDEATARAFGLAYTDAVAKGQPMSQVMRERQQRYKNVDAATRFGQFEVSQVRQYTDQVAVEMIGRKLTTPEFSQVARYLRSLRNERAGTLPGQEADWMTDRGLDDGFTQLDIDAAINQQVQPEMESFASGATYAYANSKFKVVPEKRPLPTEWRDEQMGRSDVER